MEKKLVPKIGFGSPIIRLNGENSFKYIIDIFKKIIKLNFKELKKAFRFKKILKYMKNSSSQFLVDSSKAYGASEFLIGSVLKKKRCNFYICTKVSNKDQFNNIVEEAIQDTLEKLNTDYIDLLLLHWPVPDKYIESWKILEKYYKKGILKNIGVSNFNVHHLEELLKVAEIKPYVNEIECHPLFTNNEVREYCSKHDIKIIAYTPTARMDSRLYDTCLSDIAKKYNKTIPQIIIKWHTQIGNIPIIQTSSLKHLKENYEIDDFNLTNDEIEQINGININSRLRYDPDNCNFRKL